MGSDSFSLLQTLVDPPKKSLWRTSLKSTTDFHSLFDICKKDLLASEYENISKRLNDISDMQSLALNKRQRSKFHREGVSHQPTPSIDTQKKDTIDILNVDSE